MRWTFNTEKLGNKRIRKGFLLFPKCMGNELRWLEHAKWEQEYVEYAEDSLRLYGWYNIKWLSEQ